MKESCFNVSGIKFVWDELDMEIAEQFLKDKCRNVNFASLSFEINLCLGGNWFIEKKLLRESSSLTG